MLSQSLQRGNSSSNAPALRDGEASPAAFPHRSVIINPLKKKYTPEKMIAGMEIGNLPSDDEWENAPSAGEEAL